MQETSKFSIALKYGGLLGIVQIIFSLITYLTGLSDPSSGASSILSIVNIIILVGGFYLGIKAYREANNSLSVGDAVVLGLLIGLVAGVLNAIYMYVYCTALDPEFLEKMLDQSLAQAGELDPDQEDQVRGMMSMMFSPVSMSLMVVVTNFIVGLIAGLILGLIMKKENTEYPDLIA